MPDAPGPPVSSALNAPVETDSFCIECGYNLRGLTHQGLCPECGTLKSASLRPDLLQYADPAWRDSICRGLTLLLVGLSLIAASILISITAEVFAPPLIRGYIVGPLIIIMMWSTMASICGGFWLLGTRNPSAQTEPGSFHLHRAVRLAAVAGVLSFTVAFWLIWSQQFWMMAIYELTVLGGTWSALKLMSEMSLLVPSARLCMKTARRARDLAYIAACVVIAAILHGISLHPASITAPYVHIFRIAVGVALMFLVAYITYALFVLTQFRPVLKEIAKRARAA
ncbi:MAG: hypothetical protein IID41_10570 [Planctomycetes bacterium]|nr:hypothetical protein [Planctomycetota bacterium]